jgi:hypothetical protein
MFQNKAKAKKKVESGADQVKVTDGAGTASDPDRVPITSMMKKARTSKGPKSKAKAKVVKASPKGPDDPRLPHLRKDGTRKVGPDKGDETAKLLRECVTEEDFVRACDGVLPAEEVRTRFKNCPNFGQFRMTLGNRIRGEIARSRKRQKAEKKGKKAEAAHKG